MKKLFVSQPMRENSPDEILAERNRVILKAQEALGEAVDPIPSYCPGAHEGIGPVRALANSIYLLGDADAAVFAKGWEKARGCRIEQAICLEYGIDIVEIYSD